MSIKSRQSLSNTGAPQLKAIENVIFVAIVSDTFYERAIMAPSYVYASIFVNTDVHRKRE